MIIVPRYTVPQVRLNALPYASEHAALSEACETQDWVGQAGSALVDDAGVPTEDAAELVGGVGSVDRMSSAKLEEVLNAPEDSDGEDERLESVIVVAAMIDGALDVTPEVLDVSEGAALLDAPICEDEPNDAAPAEAESAPSLLD